MSVTRRAASPGMAGLGEARGTEDSQVSQTQAGGCQDVGDPPCHRFQRGHAIHLKRDCTGNGEGDNHGQKTRTGGGVCKRSLFAVNTGSRATQQSHGNASWSAICLATTKSQEESRLVCYNEMEPGDNVCLGSVGIHRVTPFFVQSSGSPAGRMAHLPC